MKLYSRGARMFSPSFTAFGIPNMSLIFYPTGIINILSVGMMSVIQSGMMSLILNYPTGMMSVNINCDHNDNNPRPQKWKMALFGHLSPLKMGDFGYSKMTHLERLK